MEWLLAIVVAQLMIFMFIPFLVVGKWLVYKMPNCWLKRFFLISWKV